ncbi:MAG TPA: hypothetical protein VGQ54_17565 [Burkholderiales bacterium]|jgi:hypothetical protein|nr:hypothetical protein [Burkholderiales bacterium]
MAHIGEVRCIRVQTGGSFRLAVLQIAGRDAPRFSRFCQKLFASIGIFAFKQARAGIDDSEINANQEAVRDAALAMNQFIGQTQQSCNPFRAVKSTTVTDVRKNLRVRFRRFF